MNILKLFTILCVTLISTLTTGLEYEFHKYEQLTSKLQYYASKYPNTSYLYSIGKTVQDRDIWVMALAAKDPHVHVTLRPEVNFIGRIHGNELPSGELLLQFIDYLLVNPKNDTNVDYILRNVRLHILVSLNSDGAETARIECQGEQGKNNTNNVDLDANFPDKFFCNDSPIQPETKSIIEWLETTPFLLSGKVHTGSVVVSYPYENFPHSDEAHSGQESSTDNDDVFRYLASRYSLNHKTMPNETCNGHHFTDGIVNGAERYPPNRGGLTDFSYWKYGIYAVKLEIYCCVSPSADKLNEIWIQNRKSLIELTKRANTGLRGVISYKNGRPARYLGVRINSREPIMKTNEMGEYYLLVLPDTYNVSITLNCDIVFTTRVEITKKNLLHILNITLPDKMYEKSLHYELDKYPVFCHKSLEPLNCSVNYEPNQTNTANLLIFNHLMMILIVFWIFKFIN